MSSHWEYRAIGINIKNNPKPNVNTDSEQVPGLSKEFLKREFSEYYTNAKSDNIALQCQNLINIYAKRRWEHYFQGQIGNLIIFYFKREKVNNNIDKTAKLTSSEEALIQSLDLSQRP